MSNTFYVDYIVFSRYNSYDYLSVSIQDGLFDK